MTRGIRIALGSAFATSALLWSCAQPPDPAQLTALDQLISATEGALLTLNELDQARYERADSLFREEETDFRERFSDTLSRPEAKALGNQWITLSEAADMGAGHAHALATLDATSERLRALRQDIAEGAFSTAEAQPLIAEEQRRHIGLMSSVHAVMENYRLLQQAWDRRDTVTALLAQQPLP
ncbi:MAG: hypothetical protein H6591_05185 [Flavobacteriales bacterium]|nr:hypothetical protein [Flavobacteriales bacterium]